MSSQEGSEASSYDSEHYGDVARAGFVRMYALMHSSLSPLDPNRDYTDEDAKASADTNDSDRAPHFQLLYASGRHYFHGEIPMPEELLCHDADDDDDSESIDAQEKQGDDDHSPHDAFDHDRWYRRPPRRGDLAASIDVEDLLVLLPHFQQMQDSLTAVETVTHFRQELRDVVYQMEEVGEFMVEELSKDKIIDRIDQGAKEFHWMVSPENPTFFELQTYHRTNESFQDAGVVLLVMKMVVRGVLLDVIYHRDSYYVTLRDNRQELALEDAFVPTLSCVGPCYVVRRYRDTDLKQLLLWCSLPARTAWGLKGTSVSPIKQTTRQQQQVLLPAQTPSKVLKVAPGKSKSPQAILDANDTQLYCVLPTTNAKQQRESKTTKRRHTAPGDDDDNDGDQDDDSVDQTVHVIFQFAHYVYNGSTVVKLAGLNDLEKLSTHVLPSLKAQALGSLTFYGNLADMTDATELPSAIGWAVHVRTRLEEIAPVLIDLVTESQVWVEKFLSEVEAAAKESASSEQSVGWLGRHLHAWLDNGDGTEFFYELELSVAPSMLWGARAVQEDDPLRLCDAELMLWKGIVNDMVVVVVYRRGSFYVVLREVRDVNALPRDGLEFFGLLPALEGKGRGYLVRSFPPQISRRSHQWLGGAKLLLWQTVASIAREDLDAEEAQVKWLQSPSKKYQDKETAAWFEEDKDVDGKPVPDHDSRARALVRDAEVVEDAKATEASHRVKERAGKRHHLAPLTGAKPSARPAPWDIHTGCPV